MPPIAALTAGVELAQIWQAELSLQLPMQLHQAKQGCEQCIKPARLDARACEEGECGRPLH